jgi:hypothetical protein
MAKDAVDQIDLASAKTHAVDLDFLEDGSGFVALTEHGVLLRFAFVDVPRVTIRLK